ncbi:uncharacterized protein FA14DRAFT_85740 [Meira miltonrushii]|uniref:Uncharacterized protein n=1 Tax=Meira miltonrushii TaxID=1280837 RepID=A0A316V409_9BASI|nr:uncharacterized protein FA14DRAFT_85740 [Meira miltonrushii]PWN32192.1 hypothetical protein FA14DRAFT_85740 [Meira miltonrushii]
MMTSQANIGSSSNLRRPKRTKKQGPAKKQLDQIPVSSYSDPEEALDAGIQLEEKAERFAFGEKALKYYNLSFQVYQRALQLRNGNDADAAYNAARVLYIIATTFTLPPSSLKHLQDAIQLFANALALSVPVSAIDGSPNAFYLDVQYNLASAQSTLADQKQRIGEKDADVQALYQQAIVNLENVLQGQEIVLRRQLEQEAEDRNAEIERAPLLVPEGEQDENEDGVSIDTTSDSEGATRTEYTTSLITPASALETISSLHSTLLALLDSGVDNEVALSTFAHAANNLARAESVFISFPDGEKRSPENEWMEQVAALRFAKEEIDIAKLLRDVQGNISQDLMFYAVPILTQVTSVLEESTKNTFDMATTNGRAAQKVYLQQLEQMADRTLQLSRLTIGHIYSRTSQGANDYVQALIELAWQLCTNASKVYLSALKALDASSNASGSGNTVAVLGTAHSINPSMRRRASLYTGLSTVSILRSEVLFVSGAIDGVDENTRKTLLDNARIYARKALAEVGLTWMLQQPKTTSRYTAPHGGVDSLNVDTEAAMSLFRALIKRAVTLDGDAAQVARNELELFTENVKSIVTATDAEYAPVWLASFGLLSTTGADLRLLNEVIGEEGDSSISDEEKQIWAAVEQQLIPQQQ